MITKHSLRRLANDAFAPSRLLGGLAFAVATDAALLSLARGEIPSHFCSAFFLLLACYKGERELDEKPRGENSSSFFSSLSPLPSSPCRLCRPTKPTGGRREARDAPRSEALVRPRRVPAGAARRCSPRDLKARLPFLFFFGRRGETFTSSEEPKREK